MTTAHRPTYDPARGKSNEQAPTRMFSSRSLPAYTVLKYRAVGQASSEEIEQRDLRMELLEAEALHFSKKEDPYDIKKISQNNELLKNNHEDSKIKRAMILQETRNIDADDDKEEENEDDEDSEEEDDDDDETAELLRELEKIRRERAEENERLEREKAQKDEEQREREIAMGNPLLNISSRDFSVKRRWDDDVIFKNQARGISDRPKKAFVNDLLRTEFHRKFMKRYVK
ncbi:hypothetical protein T552_01165 [Pneumocystis carinii B80]|uniref:Cwf15/Cwc15 cell cycle control protein n=1 Tax=Pneumocystis carinii (strain B80) TaxID=1408658 RepID=A0A0W4ZLE7_PNEC8|nr:hypothetical protein T552_01165 [Pneumocystis carinii B80]KTW29209.1 hypothetical protein T552_01165 [Pneumocystis carinii B80]